MMIKSHTLYGLELIPAMSRKALNKRGGSHSLNIYLKYCLIISHKLCRVCLSLGKCIPIG